MCQPPNYSRADRARRPHLEITAPEDTLASAGKTLRSNEKHGAPDGPYLYGGRLLSLCSPADVSPRTDRCCAGKLNDSVVSCECSWKKAPYQGPWPGRAGSSSRPHTY